ncbi:Fused spore maturation proteins A and B [Collimonas arenae]|uniref:Fused spore maturation proteins A and B n=1 Tax=Collimonas arenae TaxID=279058 RepID=A0A0A1FD57_9BURK|nr:tyrosine-type recombinase/integrase [Collimonas arenae]AIY42456.1 Fused spore maturation proteins A and B [Collimonas arenae]
MALLIGIAQLAARVNGIPLRGVFTLAGCDIKNLDNPLEEIKNAKHQKASPDPLSTEDMEAIFRDMKKEYDPQVANYFEFAFLTGMRPEELIALKWADIDWHHATIKVQRARTFKGREKSLKMHEMRNVDLVKRAIAALKAQKPYTYLKKSDIFSNPNTGNAWHDERSQRDHYWKPTLKKLGIRERRTY